METPVEDRQVFCQTLVSDWLVTYLVLTCPMIAGAVEEPVSAGVPRPGEPGGALPRRLQLQLRGAGKALPPDGQPVRRREDGGGARAALRHPQVSANTARIQHVMGEADQTESPCPPVKVAPTCNTRPNACLFTLESH